MQADVWLLKAQNQLKTADIETAHLDCLVLLEDETGKDRAWLLSHPEYELQGSILDLLNTKIIQRLQYIPLAYIRGKAEFYGREFGVTSDTLVPRPETESLIETVKSLQLLPGSCVLDIGTGSGCIAITVALELQNVFVQACDIDAKCIAVAERNADALHANVHFYESDLLTAVDQCDVVVCNLPYVPDDYSINTAAKHEPKLALFGGSDGLNLYRELVRQITTKSWQPKYVVTESLPSQHAELQSLFTAIGYELQNTDDFIQLFTCS